MFEFEIWNLRSRVITGCGEEVYHKLYGGNLDMVKAAITCEYTVNCRH